MQASDLTAVVGDNDSGKSNILRALNLFFNGETDPSVLLDMDRDFNRHVVLNKRVPQIDIELVLELPAGYRETNGDLVRWKKSFRQGGLVKDRDWIGLRSLGIFRGRERFEDVPIVGLSRVPTLLSRIEFEYVPAIRGSDFFRFMRGRIYKVIADVAEEGFRERSGDFEQAIGEQVEPLLASLMAEMSESANLKLPNDLSEIFEKLDFLSSEKSISLNSRGDGIKGRYVPHILKFIAERKSLLYGKGTVPYTFIWAYEEPENNLEFRRAQELADFFKRLAADNLTQILITTHSPIFFNLKDDESKLCTAHFVSTQTLEQGTIAQNTVTELATLDERMGVMSIVAPYISKAANEVKFLQEQSLNLRAELEQHNAANRPTLFVEGQCDFAVVNSILQSQFAQAADNVFLFPPPQRAGAGSVGNMLLSWEFRNRCAAVPDRRRAYGILDNDGAGQREIQRVQNANGKFVTASLLPTPALIQSAIDAGFNIPVCLEEHYPTGWWAHANEQGWLAARNMQEILSAENITLILNGEANIPELIGDAAWGRMATHQVQEASKTAWAEWVVAKDPEEIAENVPGLVELLRTALVRLDAMPALIANSLISSFL
jgi:energy-coupling factor transporter ATP-binding protein EcfA2